MRFEICNVIIGKNKAEYKVYDSIELTPSVVLNLTVNMGTDNKKIIKKIEGRVKEIHHPIASGCDELANIYFESPPFSKHAGEEEHYVLDELEEFHEGNLIYKENENKLYLKIK